MEQQTNESQDQYQIISFLGHSLPDSYKALVFSRFLRSLRFGNDYYKMIDSDPYYQVYHAYLESILNRVDTKVKLAALSDNHDVVLGFSIIQPDRLHYVHVNKDYRNQGIAKTLCSDPFSVITHITNTGVSIWYQKFPKVRFNPFK